MIEQYVHLGQRVELESVTRIIADGEPQQLKKVYSSKVFDVLSAERLEILMPYEQRKLVLLPIDSEYTMYFYVENGYVTWEYNGFVIHDGYISLVERPDIYNTKLDGDLSLGIVLLHFSAVAENWVGKLHWSFGEDAAKLQLPQGHRVVATTRL